MVSVVFFLRLEGVDWKGGGFGTGGVGFLALIHVSGCARSVKHIFILNAAIGSCLMRGKLNFSIAGGKVRLGLQRLFRFPRRHSLPSTGWPEN